MGQRLGAILYDLRRERGISQKALAEALRRRGMDITNQGISKWENGLTQPNASQFLVLCDVLQVEDIASAFLGTREDGLLSDLNAEGRKKVEEFAGLLRASGRYTPDRSISPPGRVRMLPVYRLSAAAGTGRLLDGGSYEMMEAGAETPRSANFGVLVEDGSMEPEYARGEIVWVQQQPELQHGDIGVFLYDGSAYLKRLRDRVGGVRLQSLRPGHPDIVVSEPEKLLVLGKVIGSSE